MAKINVKNALEVKGGINGLKTVLGAAALVASHQVGLLGELAGSFPNAHEGIALAQTVIVKATGFLESALMFLGNIGIFGGLGHKFVKLFK